LHEGLIAKLERMVGTLRAILRASSQENSSIRGLNTAETNRYGELLH
jgi:hypothetical protein